MKVFSFVLVLVLLVFNLGAQNFDEPCSSDQIHTHLMNTNPSYHDYVDQINNRSVSSNAFRTPEVYTIPVVVHVIHEGEAIGIGSNISDAQVQSAIVALNEDFRKITGTNGDGDGVDIGIEFCLASRDPDGNSSTGIMRVDGSVVPNYAEQGIESSGGVGAVEEDVKALSVWPREDYVNIWIVNEIEDNDASGGVQGYAYFPYDNIVDGIVVLHKAFGTVGNLKPNTDQNRVITHEMGHYFSLYHTFQATTSCDAETNCSTQGDHICDTPPTILNASCSSPACAATQQVENYLDYTPEDCRNMFTQGQKDRMRDCLLFDRATLLNSLGCVPPTEYDAGISAIVSPLGSTCDTNVESVIILTNYGSQVLTSVTIDFGVDGVLDQSYDWNGTLNPGMTIEITLPAFSVGIGAHVIMAESSSPNGQEDQFAANNSQAENFSISPGVPLVLDVTLDYYGHETTWEIIDSFGDVVANGGPYPDMELGTTYQEFVCAPSGCYDLVFHDVFGDGMGFVNGHYELYGNDSLMVEGGGNFGSTETNSFCYTQEVPPGEAPVANFSVSDNTICVGQLINFTDLSLNSPTSWSWSIEGGTPAISIQQNPVGVQFNSPGSYDVTLAVSNNFGSSSSVTTIIVEAIPTLSLSSTAVSCFGGNDGSVSSQVSGNSLSYLWSNTSTQNNLIDVVSGNYTLVVTSPNGCSATSSINVESPDQLTIGLLGQNLSCSNGNDGEISSTVEGGTGIYSYLWNTGDTSANLTNLSAGYYVVTVTDQNGCQATSDVTLTQFEGIDINLVDFDVNCSLDLGAAEVNPTGGNGNYQILWSTNETGESISGLNPGNYSVTVSDTGGCSVSEDFIITQTTPLIVTVLATNVSCNELNDGQAAISVEGGLGNYSYSWNNGLDVPSSSSLSPGVYHVEIVDEGGCGGEVDFEISQPEMLTVALDGQNVSCMSTNDGEITSQVAGGTGDISYLWSNDATNEDITDLIAGYYSLTVTDENNCQASADVFLNQTMGISTNLMSFDIACNNQFGSAQVSPEGGGGNYQILWSTGSNENAVSNLPVGSYSVSISDAIGCAVSENFVIEENDSLTINLEINNITCFGLNDGRVEAFVQGGVGNYAYLWNTNATSSELTNLNPGIYSIDVVDENECYGAASFELLEPEELIITIGGQNISCFNREDGVATIQATGGTGLLSYLWTNGQISNAVSGLGAGNIGVIVEDEIGCSAQASILITEPNPLVLNVEEINEETCQGGDGAALASAEGGTGVLEYSWSNGASGIFLDDVSSGLYSVVVMDENSCTETAEVTIGYNCDDIPPGELTKLIHSDCGRNELYIQDFLTCIAIEDAEMYQWKFFNTDSGLFYEGFTIGNNETFQLQNVEGIHYNQSMNVCVRFQKNGSWSAYGDVCTVSMKSSIPTPVMEQSYCMKEEYQYNDILLLNSVVGADEYQWVFTSNDPMDSIAVISFVNQMTITPSLGFIENVEYQVVERVKIGQNWSSFGQACPFMIKSQEVDQSIVIEVNEFSIYPNPSDGNNLFLDLGNLSGSEYVINIELYDATGKLIEEFEIIPENEATHIVTHNFKTTLAPGLYFIQYTHDGDTNEKKLIVQ